MLNNDLRNKIDNLWDIFAAGGLTNPLEVIEQITYLMFIRDLDDVNNTRLKESFMLDTKYQSIFKGIFRIGNNDLDGNMFKWSSFRDLPATNMFEIIQFGVFPFIKSLHDDKNSAYTKYMDDAIFKIPTSQLLSKIVDSLDELYELINRDFKKDTKGDVYEYLLSKLSTAGRNGQFRTPRHIIRMIVELMEPSPEDIICDPSCGTGGFLVSAGEFLKEKFLEEIFMNSNNKDHFNNNMFFGYDMDRTMLRIGAMNMMTHGIDNPSIEYKDSLSDQNSDINKYSLILANPPFKGSLDFDIVSADLLRTTKTKKTELLFLALFLRMLKTGGRCASIVPDGVLFGSTKAHLDIRKEIIEKNRLEAIISMPSGVFKPYAGVSTCIIVFTKTGHGGTDKVWFYNMESDGFSLDDKRLPECNNDIPDIVFRFHNLEQELNRKKTDKSFFVSKNEIIENNYDLSINKYREIEHLRVDYPQPNLIMEEIKEIEKLIIKGLGELEDILNEYTKT